jgi:hypothetical protein
MKTGILAVFRGNSVVLAAAMRRADFSRSGPFGARDKAASIRRNF